MATEVSKHNTCLDFGKLHGAQNNKATHLKSSSFTDADLLMIAVLTFGNEDEFGLANADNSCHI